jgi:hypothetical protein
MPIYLEEDCVGADPTVICYPHLLLCMGVTVLMSDGSLVGAHVSNSRTEDEVLRVLTREINGLAPLTMQRMYCTGNVDLHTNHGGKSVQDKAAAIGFRGKAYLFDTGRIKPKDGTFVQVTSNGPNHQCAIQYKRDEKVRSLYVYTPGGQVKRISTHRGVIDEAAAKSGLSGPIHKLHRVNFLLEVKKFNIP